MELLKRVLAGWGWFRKWFHMPAPIVNILFGTNLLTIGLGWSIEGFVWVGAICIALGTIDMIWAACEYRQQTGRWFGYHGPIRRP